MLFWYLVKNGLKINNYFSVFEVYIFLDKNMKYKNIDEGGDTENEDKIFKRSVGKEF